MATRFIQDFTNKLITEAFFAEQLGSYNMPTGIDSGAIKRHKDKTDSMDRAADQVLDRVGEVTDTLAGSIPFGALGIPLNAYVQSLRGARDLKLGVGQDIGTDEYEGRRAQGVQDRLAAGEQTAPPGGGQVMGLRATSPGHEKRIEDLTHARRRPEGGGPIPSAPPTPIRTQADPPDMTKGASGMSEDDYELYLARQVGSKSAAGEQLLGDAMREVQSFPPFYDAFRSGSLKFNDPTVQRRAEEQEGIKKNSGKDTIAGSILDKYKRRRLQTEQMTTPDNPAPTYRDTPPGGFPDLLPAPVGSNPRDRTPQRNPGKGRDFQDYYRGIGWGSDPKYGDEGWNENGYPVCYGSDCRSV